MKPPALPESLAAIIAENPVDPGFAADVARMRAEDESVTVETWDGSPAVPLDADELEDYVLANAPEYVASMADADRAIERGDTVPLAETEAELGPLDGSPAVPRKPLDRAEVDRVIERRRGELGR